MTGIAAPKPPRGRGRWMYLGIAAVVAAGAATAWRAGAFSPAAASGAGQRGARAPATRTVTRQFLTATTPQAATLGYAGSYTVRGHGGGTLTWLPPAGRVIRQGRVLYRTGNGSPVVLLYGRVPAWRPLAEGVTGHDVTQLNRDLVRLGYAGRAGIVAAGWGYYSWETAQAVQRLETHLGVAGPPGNLSLGQVVFEPVALRVTQVTGSLGGPASGPVLTATSDRHVVTINLDPAQQLEVKPGDAVSITLPAGNATPGAVSSVGKVAITSSGPGAGPAPAIPVQVRLTRPKAAGSLDQAPVTALVAQSPRGYAVEVVGPGNTRRWVPVTPGIFDGANGLIQVTGALTPGQRVVVAAL